jgi:hypothetical protein
MVSYGEDLCLPNSGNFVCNESGERERKMCFIIYEWTVNFMFINTGQEFGIKICVAE